MPFLNPLFLFALAAAAIPIALHLLNRRNPKPVSFSTLRFIQTAIAKTRKSRHLTQVLILALRMLIIILLALAFARPRLRAAGWLPEGARTVVLVLDGTASMRCREMDVTRFDRARDWALDVLATLKDDDRVALIVSGAAPGRERVIFPPITNHGLVQKALQEAVCGFGAGDLVRDLQATVAQLAEQKIPGTVELHAFSDFQATGWQRQDAAALGQAIQENDMRLFINRVWSTTGNSWITDVRLAPEAILGGGDLLVRGEVHTDASFTGASTLHLFLDEAEAAQVGLPLTPAGRMPFAIEAVVAAEGAFAAGRLQLDNDPLDVDNVHYFALARQEHVRVLLVNGTSAAVPFQADTFYLNRALNPQNLENPLIRSDVIEWDDLPALDLAEYQAVLIANPPRFTANLAIKLEDYVRNGGTVSLYPGDAGGIESSQDVLKPLQALRFEVQRFPTTQTFRPVASELPHAIERRSRGALRRLPDISGKARLTIGLPGDAVGAGISTWLQFASEAPLALRIGMGGGEFWIHSLTANRDWSEWPLTPLYVIFHQLLIRESFSNRQRTSRLEVGQLAELHWPGDEKRLTGTLLEPGGKRRRIVLDRATADQPFVQGGLRLPGLYRVDLDSDPPQSRHLAVNVPTQESQLAEIGEEELAASLQPASPFQSRDWARHRDHMAGMTHGQPLWPWLLLLAFLLGIIEELVANIRSWGQDAPETIKRLLRWNRA